MREILYCALVAPIHSIREDVPGNTVRYGRKRLRRSMLSNCASVDATLALERILSSTFEKPVNEKALEPRNFPSLERSKTRVHLPRPPTLLEQSFSSNRPYFSARREEFKLVTVDAIHSIFLINSFRRKRQIG